MASAQLSRRVEKVVGYPPLSEMGPEQRREFHEALLERRPSKISPVSGRWPFSRRSKPAEPPGRRQRLIGDAGGGVSSCALLLWLGLEGLVVPAVPNGVLDQ
jgi:hypothetical protein